MVAMKATCRDDDPVLAVSLLKEQPQNHQFSLEALLPVLSAGGITVARRA